MPSAREQGSLTLCLPIALSLRSAQSYCTNIVNKKIQQDASDFANESVKLNMFSSNSATERHWATKTPLRIYLGRPEDQLIRTTLDIYYQKFHCLLLCFPAFPPPFFSSFPVVSCEVSQVLILISAIPEDIRRILMVLSQVQCE